MLGKAMRFATVCTLSFAICGKADRGKFASFSKGTAEDLEHRFGQENNFEDHLSTTMNVSSILMQKQTSETPSCSLARRLAAILALSSALTSVDARGLPGVQSFQVRPLQKYSNTAFAPIHTKNPLHRSLSGPLHNGSIDRWPEYMALESTQLAIKEMVHLFGCAVQPAERGSAAIEAVMDCRCAVSPIELGLDYAKGLSTEEIELLLSDQLFKGEPDLSEKVQSAVKDIKRYCLANPDQVETFKDILGKKR